MTRVLCTGKSLHESYLSDIWFMTLSLLPHRIPFPFSDDSCVNYSGTHVIYKETFLKIMSAVSAHSEPGLPHGGGKAEKKCLHVLSLKGNSMTSHMATHVTRKINTEWQASQAFPNCISLHCKEKCLSLQRLISCHISFLITFRSLNSYMTAQLINAYRGSFLCVTTNRADNIWTFIFYIT